MDDDPTRTAAQARRDYADNIERMNEARRRSALHESNEGICDYQVLKTFLGTEAQSFWLYFGKYTERRQAAGYAGYGEWTRKFVDGDIRRPKFLGII